MARAWPSLLLLAWHSSALVLEGPERRAHRAGGLSHASVLQRMKYWRRATSAVPSTGKYLLFTPDAGGLNNIRIGWEMTGIVALHTGRTLVLPPKTPMYLLDWGPWNKELVGDTSNWTGSTRVEDLIDVTQLKGVLPTLTMEEFEAEAGMKWHEARVKAEKSLRWIHFKQDNVRLSDYEALTDKFIFMDGSSRDGFRLGQWWLQGGPVDELRPELTEADWGLLRHGFVWHPDAFNIAEKAVFYLGMFDYVALHARYGDFAEKQSQRTPDQIYENWRPLIANASAMYVATDRQAQFDGFAQRHGVKLVMWPDLFTAATGGVLSADKQLYTPERFFKLMGPVEEVICTFAKVFVGTDRSSFTGHIQRMRIHADAPVTKRLTHTDGDPSLSEAGSQSAREIQVPLDEIQQSIQNWETRDWLVPPISQGEQFRQRTVSLKRERP
mmetsp:Transcript_97355/g.271853  ORF Transcript_97355/g.271853 Transcript_97355/m.271853 type:complete len:440 (-) Transcript_97355:153-1472(-)